MSCQLTGSWFTCNTCLSPPQISLCQKWLQLRHQLPTGACTDSSFSFLLSRILCLCVKSLLSSPSQPLSVPLRMVEVFLSPTTYHTPPSSQLSSSGQLLSAGQLSSSQLLVEKLTDHLVKNGEIVHVRIYRYIYIYMYIQYIRIYMYIYIHVVLYCQPPKFPIVCRRFHFLFLFPFVCILHVLQLRTLETRYNYCGTNLCKCSFMSWMHFKMHSNVYVYENTYVKCRSLHEMTDTIIKWKATCTCTYTHTCRSSRGSGMNVRTCTCTYICMCVRTYIVRTYVHTVLYYASDQFFVNTHVHVAIQVSTTILCI